MSMDSQKLPCEKKNAFLNALSMEIQWLVKVHTQSGVKSWQIILIIVSSILCVMQI